MTNLTDAVKAESSTEKWLVGCTMCDEGLCTFIDDLMDDQKLKQSQAIKVATEMANEKLGADIFKVGTIKQKYYRLKGITPEPKPKKKVVTKQTKQDTENTKSAEKSQETPEPIEPEVLDPESETSKPDILGSALASSLESVLAGLRAFIDAEQVTRDDGIRQKLTFHLSDMIPMVKGALSKINKSE